MLIKKINEELILLYNDVGKYIYNIKENSNHGDSVVENIANYMKNNYPTLKGFTKRNLLILSNCKSEEEREFYLNLSIKENKPENETQEMTKAISINWYERIYVPWTSIPYK